MASARQMSWDNYDDFQSKYGLDNIVARIPYTSMCMLFEEIGVLVEEGLIDMKLVVQLIRGLMSDFWEKFEPVILEYRERHNYPQYFDKMEYLYNELKKHS